MLGWLSAIDGDPAVGQGLIAEGLALFWTEPTGARWDFGRALFIAALFAMQRGDYAATRGLCASRWRCFERWGSRMDDCAGIKLSRRSRAVARRTTSRQRPTTRKACRWCDRQASRAILASLLHNLGYVALAQGDTQQAARSLARDWAYSGRLGISKGSPNAWPAVRRWSSPAASDGRHGSSGLRNVELTRLATSVAGRTDRIYAPPGCRPRSTPSGGLGGCLGHRPGLDTRSGD